MYKKVAKYMVCHRHSSAAGTDPLTVITNPPEDDDNKRNMPRRKERVNRRGRSLRVVAASAVLCLPAHHSTAPGSIRLHAP